MHAEKRFVDWHRSLAENISLSFGAGAAEVPPASEAQRGQASYREYFELLICRTTRHDLNELLVTHPAATFLWRVSGQSMIEAGIFDGDVLVVNRALTPAHKDIVVAQVDGDFSLRTRGWKLSTLQTAGTGLVVPMKT